MINVSQQPSIQTPVDLILALLVSCRVSGPELGEGDFFSRRLEEDADGHADFYLIKWCSDDVADHLRAFGQFDDRDDVGDLAGPAA